MKPLVSVIMPVYNVERYIDKSIQSVLEQKYINLELIIVIDGSPDNSGAIAEKYSNKDNRVRVLYKDNGGLSDARNYGMNFANGKYIFFLDSDDYIDKNLLEEIVLNAETNSLDVVIFGFYVDYEDKNQKVIKTKEIRPNNGIYPFKSIKNYGLTEDFFNYIGYAWNKLYRSNMIKGQDIQFTKGLSLIEDIEFNYRVLKKFGKIGFVNKCYYHYIQRPRTTLVNAEYDNFYELKMRAVELRINLLKEWRYDKDIITKQNSLLYFNAMKSAIRNIVLTKKNSFKYKRTRIKGILEINSTLNYLNELPKSLSLTDRILIKLIRYNLIGIIISINKVNLIKISLWRPR